MSKQLGSTVEFDDLEPCIGRRVILRSESAIRVQARIVCIRTAENEETKYLVVRDECGDPFVQWKTKSEFACLGFFASKVTDIAQGFLLSTTGQGGVR